MAAKLPDSPGELDYYSVEDLREMAVSIGKLGGRPGWPAGTVTQIRGMDKERVIAFIVRNHYPHAGPRFR